MIEVAIDKQKASFRIVSGDPVKIKVYGQRRTVTADGIEAALQ